MHTINETGDYVFEGPVHPDRITELAENIIRATFNHEADVLSSPAATRRYCVHRLAKRDREVFMAVWLNNRHQVLAFEELSVGTIDAASVYPREVVLSALSHKAAAVIFAHQHPSGHPEPSDADRRITRRLKDALALLDIRVLDHLVVGGARTVSFSERGLI